MNDTTVQTNKEPRLQGNMGVFQLVMSVLAFSGPLCVAAAFVTSVLMDAGSAAHGYTS